MTITVPPFQLLYPMIWDYRIEARFNDPADYSGLPNRVQKREGMLFIPQSFSRPLDVRAVQRGIVREVGFFGQGYGNFVRIEHEWYGHTYVTWYGHLERVDIRKDAYVSAGDVIGIAGHSGSTDETSLFLTVQHLGKGSKNYVVDDVIDPEPLFVTSLAIRDEAWWVADVTIVDGTIMKPGEQFRKTWRLRNSGTTTWEVGYELTFYQDNPMGTGASVPLPAAVPGELVEVSVNLTAPNTLGSQRSTWIPKNPQGTTFPHEQFALIDVRQAQQVVGKSLLRWRSDVTIPDGQQVQPGEHFRKTWRVLNDGETTWGNGYELAFFKDNPMGTGTPVALPPLAPGQEGEISVELIAPNAPGRHKSTWKPCDPQGRMFTFDLYADIAVPASAGEVIQGSCNATVRRDTQAKLRNAPSMTGQQLATLSPSTAVRVLGVTADRDSDGFRWIQVNANNQQGYIREDLLTYAVDCADLDLPVTEESTDDDGTGQTPNPQVLFTTPVQGNYIVYQEFGVNGHKGSDLSGTIGLPIIAGGNGLVTQVILCSFCTDSAPNFASHGLPMWDENAIRDRRWGYGFGNHVIVSYAWNDLPGNMRVAMANQGLSGGYAYVVYGHLHRVNVQINQRVSAGTTLGQLGNTGNSSGPHLHVELRVADQPNLTTIFQKLVMNPRTMFDI